jgi:NAD(P)H-hydrate epimerase
MVKLDRLMEQRGIPLSLMMENAGVNLARLAFLVGKQNTSYLIISGSGGNGGGGMVAARRLSAWGCKTSIFLPKGKNLANKILENQLTRAKMVGVDIFEGIPANIDENTIILDSYLGYSFEYREDELTEEVFSFLRRNIPVISLDCPSGIDITTGENFSKFRPLATLTIAFVKTGLLNQDQEYLGDFYVIDIGVPIEIYRSEIGIEWIPPYTPDNLDELSKAFVQDPIQNVKVLKDEENNKIGWKTI